jgi:hypothetical protein
VLHIPESDPLIWACGDYNGVKNNKYNQRDGVRSAAVKNSQALKTPSGGDLYLTAGEYLSTSGQNA